MIVAKRIVKYVAVKYFKRQVRTWQSFITPDEIILDYLTSFGALKSSGTLGLKSCYVSTEFGQMHYYDSAPLSREKPLLLVHGLGSSGQCFFMSAKLMQEHRRVVIPDLFHFQGFSKPNNAIMSITEHAESLVQLVDAVSDTGCDFCGLSLGGWIGMKMCLNFPTKIDRLILLNPAGLKIRNFQLKTTLMNLSWAKFQSFYPGVLAVPPYQMVPGFSEAARRSLYRLLKAASVRNILKTITEADFLDADLSKIQNRVLLLWGAKDRLLSEKSAEILANQIKDIEAYFVPSCAHVLSIEAPVLVDTCIRKFLDLPPAKSSKFLKILKLVFPYGKTVPIIACHD